MGAVGRTLVALLLLLSAPVHAQTAPPLPNARARELLSRTKAGHEKDVACDELDTGLARTLIDLGQQARSTSLERATVAFRLAERAARCAASDPLVGAALNDLGDVLFRRGDLDPALAAAEESIRIHEHLKDDAGLAQAWNDIANVRWTNGDMHGAGEAQEHSLALWTAAGDRNGQARSLNNLGNIRRALGEFDTALDYFIRALHTLEELGDRRSAAIVTDNIGIVYFWRGEYGTALEYSLRALGQHRAIGNQYGAAKSLDSLGNIYRMLGAYGPALQSFRQALQLRHTLDDKPGVMETSHNIGLVHFSQADYELAIDAYKQGLRLNRFSHDQSFASEALRNIGAAAWRLGQHDRAVANFRASLAIAEREHLRAIEGELVHDLGTAALAEGRVASASLLFDRALGIRRTIGDQAGISDTLTALAETRLAEHRPTAALELAQRALDNASAHDQTELVWTAQTLVGTAHRRLHHADEARRSLSDAVGSIEQLSAQLTGSENLRQRFFENKLSPYHELMALYVEQGAFSEALELAERSKAHVLIRLLRGTRFDESTLLSTDEKRERTRLRDRLFALNRQIDDEVEKQHPEASRVVTLESTRHAVREELAAFETAAAAQHPELATLRGEISLARPAEASRVFTDPTTAMVEFAVAEDQLFVFTLTSDGFSARVDARAIAIGRSELATRAERFRARVGSRDFAVLDDARALYDTLLAPIRQQLAGKSRIVVIPDGPLWNVPFQALRGPEGYLIEAAAVSYAPSITTLREIQRLPRSTAPRTLLAMGKSTFGEADSALASLPDAELQVRQIAALYGRERSATYVGAAATETQFKAVAVHYSVLHLATHGVLDETSSLYSHLVLSASRDAPEDDGKLEAWEIMRMKLTADLVVLAACDTGRGRIAPGEGVIGTMWALFAAGARSMVVSQFRVESKSATTLLLGLHRRLASEPGSKAAQLRSAALDLLHTPRYAHPYYWSGFILVGDPD